MDEESPRDDRFVSFRSVPKLENIALVTLVCNTWNVRELKTHLIDKYEEFYFHESDAEIEQYLSNMEEKIMDNLKKCLSPELLDKAGNFVKPMGRQIFRWLCWMRFHFSNVYYSMYMKAICWTINGTIDRLKTFELLLETKNRNNTTELYNIACHDCNQARVLDIWRKASNNNKPGGFWNVNMFFLKPYWTGFMKMPGRLTKKNMAAFFSNEEKSKEQLEGSIREGNIAGVKFFWDKLPNKVRSDNIVAWIESIFEKEVLKEYDVYHETNGQTDVMCFFLSHMRDQKQQAEVFRKHSESILNALLLHWPWQEFLLPTMRAMFHFLEDHIYVRLLSKLVLEIKAGRTTQLLLQQLWCESPMHLKKSFISHIVKNSLDVFWRLFRIEDMATIRLILNDASVEEKKEITFSLLASENKKLFYGLIYSYNFKFFEMLFEKTLSENDIVEFKDQLLEVYGEKLCYPWIGKVNWQPLEVILDWCFSSREKLAEFKEMIFKRHIILRGAISQGAADVSEALLHWCIDTVGDLNQFRAEFPGGFKVITSGTWELFEKILYWCLESSEDVEEQKRGLLYNWTIFDIFKRSLMKYDFSCATSFMNLSLSAFSLETARSGKRKLFTSSEGQEIFEFYVTNRCMFGKEYQQWDLVKKLVQWFYPLNKRAIIRTEMKLKYRSLSYFSHENEFEKLFYYFEKFTRDSADTGPYEGEDFNIDDTDGYDTDDTDSDDVLEPL